MKFKLFLSSIVAAVLFFPTTGNAAQFLVEDTYSLNSGDTVDEHVYLLTESALINGDITKDLFLGASDINLSGNIGDDVFLAAETADIAGTVSGDVRALTGKLTVQGIIEGDLMVASGIVFFSEEAVVKGNVYLGVGEATLNGVVEGNVVAYGDDVTVNGTVQGNTEAFVSKLSFAEGASVEGNLTYEAMQEAQGIADAEVSGEVLFTQAAQEDDQLYQDFAAEAKEFFFFFSIAAWGMSFLTLLLLGVALYALAKKPMQRVLDRGQKDFLESFLYGLGVFILWPIVTLLLFVTLIGSKLAWLLLFVYLIALLLAKLGAALLIGQYLLQAVQKERYQFTWKTLVVGIVLLTVLKLIPFVGGLVAFVFMLAALGTGYQVASTWLKAQRA